MDSQRIVRMLVARGLTVGMAESLTGGLVCAKLTDAGGASDAVAGAIVSYTNEVKQRALGVPAVWLDHPGPVSAQVAAAMVTGVIAALGVDVGVATTGEAGPDSGSGQPVGTVFVAVGGCGERPLVRQLALSGTRAEIRMASVTEALALLEQWLNAVPAKTK